MGLILLVLFAMVLVGSFTAAAAARRRAAQRKAELAQERVEQLAAGLARAAKKV